MIGLDAIPYTPARWRRARTQPAVAVCIHTAESSESTRTAEVLAAYFAGIERRAGIHYNVDADSITCSARPEVDTVPHCYQPSSWSIGIEHAGRAGQGAAGWADTYSIAMLERSAQLTAALCQRFAIPAVRLTPDQVRAQQPGIFGHHDATVAFQVAGGHTDPGPDFPWGSYIARVAALLTPQPVPTPEDPMGATIAQLDTWTTLGPAAVTLDGTEIRGVNGAIILDVPDEWRVVGLDGRPVPDVVNLDRVPIVGTPTDILRSGVTTVTVWTRSPYGRHAYTFRIGVP